MKISKSKQKLARIISENGGWRDGEEWAAQDSNENIHGARVCFYNNKPCIDDDEWRDGENGLACDADDCIEGLNAIKNWHQTILSREEYFHLYPATDDNGWIEWKGGECPVEQEILVDIKDEDGTEWFCVKAAPQGEFSEASDVFWEWNCTESNRIVAYRLHKPEQAKPEFCKSVARSIPDPEGKPTIEQMAADYRNANDYALRLQEKANSAWNAAEKAKGELIDAGKSIGIYIQPIIAKQDPELVITDWRDLQVGDEVEVFDFDDPDNWSQRKAELMSGVCVVMRTGAFVHIELKSNLPKERDYWNAQGVDKCKFRFIRRP